MEVQVLSELHLTPVSVIHPDLFPRPGYQLTADFSIRRQGKFLTVPAGFAYNGASIPVAMFQIAGTPFNPKYMEAACVHDWIYTSHILPKRLDADRLFRDMLIAAGVSRLRANNLFQALYFFGRYYWGVRERDTRYLEFIRAQLTERGKDPTDYGL